MTKKKQPDPPARGLFGEGADVPQTDMRTFEERLARLEEIVARMETGGLGLAESLDLFEEGNRQAKGLSAMLADVRERVLKLAEAEDGTQVLDDFTGETTP